MKKLIFVILIIAAINEGCKKYEEGPTFSLRSAKNRLYGSYTLIKYMVDGQDSLTLYNDSIGTNFCFSKDPGNIHDICLITGDRKDGIYMSIYWQWSLENRNRNLIIKVGTGNTGIGPFGFGKKPEWEILRLTNREVKMKTNFNGKEYYVELN